MKSHQRALFLSLRRQFHTIFDSLIKFNEQNLMRCVKLLNDYMSICEFFLDSKQKHFHTYFVSPISFEIQHNISYYFTLNQWVIVPITAQVFQIQREISKALSQEPNTFQKFSA
jgi:hypothetical protein